MFFLHIVLAVAYCAVFVGIVNTQSDENVESEGEANHYNESKEKNAILIDNHTFVALIDIVFTDGSKRTCTGAIIHDNVVITAAHCFVAKYNPEQQPELTASFVVIGTKKMFETGYEQYLPIERVITHPKYKGWTADLSLIYTFAGMTSDKPGTIIPLAGEKTKTLVDSNITLLSWGTMTGDVSGDGHQYTIGDYDSRDETKPGGYKENNNNGFTVPLLLKLHKRARSKSTPKVTEQADGLPDVKQYPLPDPSKNIHLYWHRQNIKYHLNDTKYRERKLKDSTQVSREPFNRDHLATDPEKNKTFESYYNNWRRHMGTQQNQLAVEVFGFVNMKTCKNIFENAMAAKHHISETNDFICYAGGDRIIIDDDVSGAPAVRNGQLIAVTLGSAECDGDRVAIGMKMSCYCSWIAENLPKDGDRNMNCCKNCCEVTHKEERKKENKYKLRNKYLIK